MSRARRLTLGPRLAISFAGVGVLVAALWMLGDHILRDAASRLEGTLTAQVAPLARINRLQSQVNRIRVLEVELPRLSDLFAVSERLSFLHAEGDALDRDLDEFARELKPLHPAEIQKL